MLRSRSQISAGLGAVRSDPRGFSRLGWLHQQLRDLSDQEIEVNLSRLDWFDGHMAAPLKIVIRHAEARGNRINLTRPKPEVETVLRKNLFLPGQIRDYHRTTMPITEFGLDDGKKFAMYAKQHLDRREMPKMSAALRGKFYEGIDELFANSALHSKSERGIVACGQFFPTKDRLDFTVTDGGRGIPSAVRSVRGALSDPQAIDWAMTPYNTTRRGDIPGGLGSKILRDFVELNGGKLVIASNGGFWYQEGDRVTVLRLSCAFPGTSVLLEVNTSDRKQYDLVAAPHPRDIW